MISPRTSKRLVQLFERDLRGVDGVPPAPEDVVLVERPAPRRASQELERQVVEFAAEVRSSGSTPEQMLVELKGLLGTLAPDIPGSERNALLSALTGRAIEAFFESAGGGKGRKKKSTN